MESNGGLSRKDQLAIWRTKKAGTGASAGAGGKGKSKAGAGAGAVNSTGSEAGVLAERAGNSNVGRNGVPGKKRAGLSSSSHVGAAASKGERRRGPQRKPFQVGQLRHVAGAESSTSLSRETRQRNLQRRCGQRAI